MFALRLRAGTNSLINSQRGLATKVTGVGPEGHLGQFDEPPSSSGAGAVGHSGHLPAGYPKGLRNEHDGPVASSELSATAKYLFDLNGYLVLPGAMLGEDNWVGRANAAVDAHIEQLHERKGVLRTSGLYGRQSGLALQGDGATGRFDMGGMLGWEAPHCDPFREVLAHRNLAPALHTLLGPGYRLDHSPLLIAMTKGSEGHTLHGGAVTESGEPAWPLAYSFRHGHMRNQLLSVAVNLSDAPEGAGGFCAVPGSHKSNFPVPPELADLNDSSLADLVRQPVLKAGDVLLFSEATLHGTLPWTADFMRRTVVYRFAPAGSAYGRGYLAQMDQSQQHVEADDEVDCGGGGAVAWPEATVKGMTPAQRAVLLPPYHPRMNRPHLDEHGNRVLAKPREAFKVEFDERVFGTRYF